MGASYKLFVVRTLHSGIFLVMAGSVLYVLVCGILGRTDRIFVASLILLAVEGAVFFGNGMRCPLTALAKSYGATKGYVFDTWFPERLTRYTFPFFGSILLLGLILWVARLFA